MPTMAATGRAERMLAQALAKELSAKGVHVAHVVANGRIKDKQGEDQLRGEEHERRCGGEGVLASGAAGARYVDPMNWS